jgi:hypothetical protein
MEPKFDDVTGRPGELPTPRREPRAEDPWKDEFFRSLVEMFDQKGDYILQAPIFLVRVEDEESYQPGYRYNGSMTNSTAYILSNGRELDFPEDSIRAISAEYSDKLQWYREAKKTLESV